MDIKSTHPKEFLYGAIDIFETVDETLNLILAGAQWNIEEGCVRLAGAGLVDSGDLSHPIHSLTDLRIMLALMAKAMFIKATLNTPFAPIEYSILHANEDADDILGLYDDQLTAMGWIGPDDLPTSESGQKVLVVVS